MRRQHTPFSIILIFIIVFAVMVSASPLATPLDSAEQPQQDSTLSVGDTIFSATSPTTESTVAPTDPEPTQTEPTQPEQPTQTDFPSVSATSAFIYDSRTNELRTNVEDPTALLYPSSITKLFTAYIALQYLDLSAQITVGSILDTVPDDSSTALLSKGNKLTAEALFYGMLLPSGNDAARVIAVAVGKIIDGTTGKDERSYMSIFVDEMNRQAQLVGFVNSNFVTPDGYHDKNHYMCLADMVTLGKLCLSNPTIMQIVGTNAYTAKVSGKKDGLLWPNSNEFLRKSSDFYTSAALGLKTGNTGAAGPCLLSAFSVEDGYVLIGTFHCGSLRERFTDTLTLLKSVQS